MAETNLFNAIQVRLDAKGLEDLAEDFAVMDELIPEYLNDARAQIEVALENMIMQAFYAAAEVSNLPTPYITHLAQGIRENLMPEVYNYGTELHVDIPDISNLGTEEDLYAANHYQAIAEPDSDDDFSVSNPPRVDIGADESELYARRGQNAGNDAEMRQQYFEAMAEGQSTWTIALGKESNLHFITVPIPPIDETFYARIVFWGDRYPEWILLEYGDEVLGISPGGFYATVSFQSENLVAQYIEVLADTIVEALERGRKLRFAEGSRAEIITQGGKQRLISRGAGGRFSRVYE